MLKTKPYVCYWVMALAVVIPIMTFGQYHVKPFDISKKITALENTNEGYILYGTEKGEYGTYDGLLFHRIENLGARINKIEVTDDAIYLSTSKGLYEDKNGNITQISPNNLDVLDRSNYNQFLVTSQGVYKGINSEYSPDKEDFYTINEIERGSYFQIGRIECFRADEKVYFKDKRWREVITHAENDFSILPWNSEKMIIADRKGLITFDQKGYVDTLLHLDLEQSSTIFKLEGSELLLCANDSIGIFDVRKREVNQIYALKTELITDVIVDDWGNSWISAGSYLYQVIDRLSEERNEPPLIEITSIQINGSQKDLKSSFRLNEGNNEIEIDYSGVHLTDPQNLEFQTKLSRVKQSIEYSPVKKSDWTTPTKKRSIEYRNLEPGKYSFQLRGSVDGEYFMYTKPIVFSVESNAFQSIWLIGFLGALGILLSALFFNSRYNSLKKKSEQDREKLVRENKMLTLQQKALQLQMNPHFVFNSLNSIQGLIANEDNQKARRYLQEFSTMMRSVLNQSREETILLNDEIKYLKSYLNLEQMANNNKFDWEVKINHELEDDIQIPTMIIQPFVENAILHGVKPLKDKRGKIQLTFELEGSKIICKVIDNGIGRKAAGQLKSSNHKSVAIDVVKERLSSKLKTSKNAPIKYIDLLDSNEQVVGTEVSISIPIMN